MKRLIRKANHDIGRRDKALLYIDGKVYAAFTHGDAIKDYVKENMPDGKYREEEKDDWNYIINNNPELDDLPMGFGHLVIENKDGNEASGIYVETYACENCSPSEVISAFKAAYPDYDVYDEEAYTKKLAKLNKTAVSQTTRDKAILYMDGELYEGENHTPIIDKVYDEKRKNGEFVNYDNVYNAALAFIHMQKDDGRYKEGLYIEDDSLMNCTLEEVISALKNKYPDTPIYSNTAYDDKEDYYTRLASKIKLKIGKER